ncbi:MAG: peptide chain release factor 3 [Solirubrobacteraceae bacterium]|nr:peptide chain release factor 3 [Solirubrobacteraceae bacterium]
MLEGEAARRRTFAIISHPDAGKTTLTEKLLLYGGQLREAGQVQARGGRRNAVSDWTELEQTRGISVTSTSMRFEHAGTMLNLLDTPGHRDFSEDTLRVLAAADSAVILLDAARGVQEQTRMLFEVARARGLPLITFINKFDRPGMEPLEMLDHIETELNLRPAPLTWPVGSGGEFRGLIDRRTDRAIALDRTPRGAQAAHAETASAQTMADDPHWAAALEESELVSGAGEAFDEAAFLSGTCTPVLFGSAMWNFGISELLDVIVTHAPPPQPRFQVDGQAREVGAPFSAQVFKVQANTDPRHRDRLAFLRVCSGRFERGMRVTNVRTGRPITLAHVHEVFGRDRGELLEAWPGDVMGVSGVRELRVGDTVAVAADTSPFRAIATLVPEHLVTAHAVDSSKRKQFRRGLEQLDEEGVVHLLSRLSVDDRVPTLGAVGQLQLEVCLHRMRTEFGCEIRLDPTPWTVTRRVDASEVDKVLNFDRAEAFRRGDGATIAAFADAYRLRRFIQLHPEVELTRLLGDVPATVLQ